MRALATLALLAAAARAQDLTERPARAMPSVAITNARIHPVSGPVIERGYVILAAGRITAVGAGAPELAAGFETIDARGARVYPGLIAPYTQLGLVEIGAVRASRDTVESGDITPEARAAVAVNPDSTLLPVTRSNGILTFASFPAGGLIAGRASVMAMEGWTWEEMAIRADAGLVVRWPGAPPRRRDRAEPAPMPRLLALTEAFDAAAAYLRARAAAPETPEDVRWEAMRACLGATTPLFVEANDYDQITGALEFAARRGLRPVLVGGRDALLCLDLVKRCGAAVILDGIHDFPRRNDSDFDEVYRLPARLEEAGVPWCMGGGDRTANERNLPYTAARAVAYGLAPDAALRSITLSAAQVLGVADEIGSLEAGKRATLFLSDGDPLEVTSKVLRAFIDGREIPLSNKQTVLAEKYRAKYR